MNLQKLVMSRQEALLACLQENLRIPSVEGTPQPGAPYGIHARRSLDHILKTAESLGFPTHNLDGHAGWCEYGEGEEMVAVLGHLDVVPAGEGWTVDPWGGEIRGDRIYGRGTMDDKGPCVAALFALDALRESGLPLKRRVRLIFGCNEETGARDMKYYLSSGGEIPVMGFTPDAEYPIINGEKGIINAHCRKQYSQSGPLRLIYLEGGTAANVVPSFAKAELTCRNDLAEEILTRSAEKITLTRTGSGILVEAEGENAHGSIPWAGENAIGRLVSFLSILPFEGELGKILTFLAKKLGMDTVGKASGIHLWDAVSGDLSLNWGVMRANESDMELVINYRYPVTFSFDDCGPAFRKLFEDEGFSVEQSHKEKLYIPADAPLVTTLLKVYEDHTGLKGDPVSIGGGTYAKCLPNILAFGPVFPGDEVREHKADEFMEIPKLMKHAQIIAAAMYEMAK